MNVCYVRNCNRDNQSKKHESETPKERRKRRIRNRLVYNDWGLNGFVQMLIYKCLRFGKELYIIDESDTMKMSTHLDTFRKADHHDTEFYS